MPDTDHRVTRCATCSTRATVIVHETGEPCPVDEHQCEFEPGADECVDCGVPA